MAFAAFFVIQNTAHGAPSKVINCRANATNCLACTLQGEAGNQGRTGMEFVASTVISRVHNRGVSICRAVRKSQFEGNNQKKREVSSTAIAVAKKYAQSNSIVLHLPERICFYIFRQQR